VRTAGLGRSAATWREPGDEVAVDRSLVPRIAPANMAWRLDHLALCKRLWHSRQSVTKTDRKRDAVTVQGGRPVHAIPSGPP
jgi:hypothetical protein